MTCGDFEAFGLLRGVYRPSVRVWVVVADLYECVVELGVDDEVL